MRYHTWYHNIEVSYGSIGFFGKIHKWQKSHKNRIFLAKLSTFYNSGVYPFRFLKENSKCTLLLTETAKGTTLRYHNYLTTSECRTKTPEKSATFSQTTYPIFASLREPRGPGVLCDAGGLAFTRTHGRNNYESDKNH